MDSAAAQSALADETGAAAEDCCNDAETAAMTDELCKTGSQCSSSGACVLPLFHARLALPVATATPLPALVALIPSIDPSGVWRPPSLS